MPILAERSQTAKTISAANKALRKVGFEIERNKKIRRVKEKLTRRLITDDKMTLYRTVIANVIMARVPGERRFTASSWMPNADGYLPRGKESISPFQRSEVQFGEIPSISDAVSAVKNIFNGEVLNRVGGSSAYESQVERISANGDVLFRFLQQNEAVPANVRDIMQTIGSSEMLKTKILKNFGKDAKSVVSKFFPEGFEDFQTMTIYRYTTDFVRGVETQLVFTQKPRRERLKRRFAGKWENYDFSKTDDNTVKDAIEKTLAIGSHRIDKLNNQEGIKKTTFKDWQEYFEKVIGWDTHEMKFLRGEPLWTFWNSIGATWGCICFSRQPLFNTETFQQF